MDGRLGEGGGGGRYYGQDRQYSMPDLPAPGQQQQQQQQQYQLYLQRQRQLQHQQQWQQDHLQPTSNPPYLHNDASNGGLYGGMVTHPPQRPPPHHHIHLQQQQPPPHQRQPLRPSGVGPPIPPTKPNLDSLSRSRSAAFSAIFHNERDTIHQARVRAGEGNGGGGGGIIAQTLSASPSASSPSTTILSSSPRGDIGFGQGQYTPATIKPKSIPPPPIPKNKPVFAGSFHASTTTATSTAAAPLLLYHQGSPPGNIVRSDITPVVATGANSDFSHSNGSFNGAGSNGSIGVGAGVGAGAGAGAAGLLRAKSLAAQSNASQRQALLEQKKYQQNRMAQYKEDMDGSGSGSSCSNGVDTPQVTAPSPSGGKVDMSDVMTSNHGSSRKRLTTSLPILSEDTTLPAILSLASTAASSTLVPAIMETTATPSPLPPPSSEQPSAPSFESNLKDTLLQRVQELQRTSQQEAGAEATTPAMTPLPTTPTTATFKVEDGSLARAGTVMGGVLGVNATKLITHDVKSHGSGLTQKIEGPGPVVLMAIGKTGQGKSSLLNRIMGTSELKASASVRAVTKGIAERTGWGKFEDNRRVLVTLVDTPGLADTEGDDEKNIPILKENIRSVGTRLGVTAFLLVFKIDSGVDMILTILQAFNDIMKDLPNFWGNVILVFTGCDFRRNVMNTKQLYHEEIQAQLEKHFFQGLNMTSSGNDDNNGTSNGDNTQDSFQDGPQSPEDEDEQGTGTGASGKMPLVPMIFLTTAESPCGFSLGEKCDCKARTTFLNAGLKRLWYAVRTKKRWVLDQEDDELSNGHS